MLMKRKISIEGGYIPINTFQSQERIDEVAKRLDILERASAAARKEEPRSEDKDMDENQRSLIINSDTFIKAVARTAAHEISERIRQIRELTPRKLETGLEQINIRRQVAEAREALRGDLDSSFVTLQRAWSALRGFEEEARVPFLSAKYKDDRLMNSASIAALTIGESCFNAFSFEQMQDQGLLGGLLLALSVSAANVLMGFGTGWLGWRLMIHRRWSHKLLGTFVTVLGMGSALMLHLSLGRLREVINTDPKATIDFLVFLSPSKWFAFTSISPFIVVAIGIGTFLIAALKGRGGSFGVVAPYWGHDVVDRDYRKAERAFQDTKDNLINGLMNAFDGGLTKLRARLGLDVKNVEEIRRLKSDAESVRHNLGDSIEDEIERLHIWLRMYRDRNRTVRNTPAPVYFDIYPEFEKWRETRLDLSELVGLAKKAEEQLLENTASLAELEMKTLQEQTSMIDAIQTMVAASERRAGQQIEKDEAPSKGRKI